MAVRAVLPATRGNIVLDPMGDRQMNTNSKDQMVPGEGSRPASAEQRLKELGIKLPAPPEPFGPYVEAVQTGNLLFLSGMLPTEGHGAKFIGRVGAELDVEAGRKAAHLAALNVLAVARQNLGSLDKVTRIVRLGVSVATSGDVRDQPKVADAASELLQDVFGKDRALAAWCMASQAFRSACRSSWKSFSRCRGHIEHDGSKINGGEPPAQRGSDSRDSGSASIVGPDSRKRAFRGTPDFLSLDTHRWGVHLLQGGRPQGGADASPAARASLFIADVRGSLPPVVRPLSPCRARLPRLRTQRLARPENLRVYVRSLRGSHESLHRGARPFAIHALHAGLRWPGRFSHGPGPSRPDRGPHRPGRGGPQRGPGRELEGAARVLGRSRRQREHASNQSFVAGDDADAPCRKRPQRGTLRPGSLDR